ncbi:hypothetical protein OJJOAM_004686 [Cupriavidus sp. H18C1]|uniref:hypothetical protein n=1 Tax=Cupriavidus sp. H18C1 TaxID=3241601 RepID=UPI003BB8C354
MLDGLLPVAVGHLDALAGLQRFELCLGIVDAVLRLGQVVAAIRHRLRAVVRLVADVAQLGIGILLVELRGQRIDLDAHRAEIGLLGLVPRLLRLVHGRARVADGLAALGIGAADAHRDFGQRLLFPLQGGLGLVEPVFGESQLEARPLRVARFLRRLGLQKAILDAVEVLVEHRIVVALADLPGLGVDRRGDRLVVAAACRGLIGGHAQLVLRAGHHHAVFLLDRLPVGIGHGAGIALGLAVVVRALGVLVPAIGVPLRLVLLLLARLLRGIGGRLVAARTLDLHHAGRLRLRGVERRRDDGLIVRRAIRLLFLVGLLRLVCLLRLLGLLRLLRLLGLVVLFVAPGAFRFLGLPLPFGLASLRAPGLLCRRACRGFGGGAGRGENGFAGLHQVLEIQHDALLLRNGGDANGVSAGMTWARGGPRLGALRPA